jgi:hypothetical protein
MSDDTNDGDHRGDDPVAPAEPSERVTDALHAFAAGIEPSTSRSWSAITGELDAGAASGAGRRSDGRVPRAASGRGARLGVAAAMVAAVAIASTALVLARRTDDAAVRVTTAPDGTIPTATTSIVAVTTDGALVELATDGRQVRTIWQPPAGGPPEATARLNGPVSVSTDRTAYVERRTPQLCNGYIAAADTLGEIVAIPLDGGEPRTVAAVGADPAISPDGTHLAYVGPVDNRCGPSHLTWALHLLDLTTGASSTIAMSAGLGRTPAPQVGAVRPAWTPDGDLLALTESADEGCPNPALRRPCGYRTILHMSGLVVVTDLTPTDAPAGSVPPIPRPVADDSTDALAVVPAPPGSAPGTAQALTAGVNLDGTLVQVQTMLLDAKHVHGHQTPLFDIPAAPGSRLEQVDLSAADQGRLLVATQSTCAPAACPTSTFELYLYDGHQAKAIASDMVAAAFLPGSSVSSSGGPSAGPVGTVDAVAGGQDASPGTTAPTGDHAADLAAISDAFNLTFHGNFSRLQDGESIRPSTNEGKAQNPDIATGVVVRLNEVRFVDADHAQVDFELLKDGVDVTAPSTGGAVRVDGTWFVTKATMCDLLQRGGIACPGAPPTTSTTAAPGPFLTMPG